MNEAPQETDVIGLLKKMQQQLVYLEKKIDTLIAQRPVQEGRPPFQKDRNFSRPFRPYGRPHSSSRPDHGRSEHSRPEYGNREQSNRPERPAHFNKHRSEGGGHSSYPKKKPFYEKRPR